MYAEAPELADLVARLHALAEQHAARGDEETARTLSALAQVALLTSAELIARLEARGERARASAEVVARLRRELASREEAPEEEEDETRRTDEDEEPRARAAARRRRPSPPPESPDDGEADASSPPDTEAPANEADVVRQRLARVAARLSELAPVEDDRVVMEGVQTRLIEADRALAEGLTTRAAELADEAQRLLASLTGEPVAPPVDSGNTLLREARERLGEDASFHGGAVAVRLDAVVRWSDGEWRSRSGRVLSGTRALVRGFRDSTLTLVMVGSPTASAFADERDSLGRFLANRFQIPVERLQWSESTRLPLSRGTYLVVAGHR